MTQRQRCARVMRATNAKFKLQMGTKPRIEPGWFLQVCSPCAGTLAVTKTEQNDRFASPPTKLGLNALADRAPEFAQSVQCCLHIVTTGCGRLGALKEITLSSQCLDSERASDGKDD